MKIIFYSLLCTFVITGGAGDSNSTSTLERKILNGVDCALQTEVLFVSVLKILRSVRICSATVITPYTFITTAQCIHKYENSKNLMNEIFLLFRGKDYYINSIQVPDGYKIDEVNYNFGVIKAVSMLENVPLIATIADFPNALEPLYIYGDKTVGHGFCTINIKITEFATCYKPAVKKLDWMECGVSVECNFDIGTSLLARDMGSPVLNSAGLLVGILVSAKKKGFGILKLCHEAAIYSVFSSFM